MGKIFPAVCVRKLVSMIYKELKEINYKKQKAHCQMGHETKKSSPKVRYKWLRNIFLTVQCPWTLWKCKKKIKKKERRKNERQILGRMCRDGKIYCLVLGVQTGVVPMKINVEVPQKARDVSTICTR